MRGYEHASLMNFDKIMTRRRREDLAIHTKELTRSNQAEGILGKVSVKS